MPKNAYRINRRYERGRRRQRGMPEDKQARKRGDPREQKGKTSERRRGVREQYRGREGRQGRAGQGRVKQGRIGQGRGGGVGQNDVKTRTNKRTQEARVKGGMACERDFLSVQPTTIFCLLVLAALG